MSTFTIHCPQCNSALRSAHPLEQMGMVRCPQCSHLFSAPESDAATALVPVERSAKMKTGLIAFGIVGSLVALLSAGIAASLITHNRELRDSVDAERRATDERLAAMQKRIDEQREEIDKERRLREMALRNIETRVVPPEEKRVEAPKPISVPPPAPPMPETKPPVESTENKARAEYDAHMDAGRAAMVAQRYDDALNEYKAALRLVPGDALALRGVRDAGDRLATVQDRVAGRSEISALIDKARTALKAKHYDEALTAANAALKLDPGDIEAKQAQRDVTAARRVARNEFAQLMSLADDARANGRFEEASRLYARALDVLPDDPAAQRAKLTTEQTSQDTQAGLSAYYRFMVGGTLAMQNGQFLDASRAFAEALRLVPTDLAAARGLRDAQIAATGVISGQAAYYRQLQAGYAALQAQRPAAAVAAFQSALGLVPNSPLAAVGLQQAQAMKR